MRYELTPLRERLDAWWERIYLCGLRRKHRTKMQSFDWCIRCGKPVER